MEPMSLVLKAMYVIDCLCDCGCRGMICVWDAEVFKYDRMIKVFHINSNQTINSTQFIMILGTPQPFWGKEHDLEEVG